MAAQPCSLHGMAHWHGISLEFSVFSSLMGRLASLASEAKPCALQSGFSECFRNPVVGRAAEHQDLHKGMLQGLPNEPSEGSKSCKVLWWASSRTITLAWKPHHETFSHSATRIQRAHWHNHLSGPLLIRGRVAFHSFKVSSTPGIRGVPMLWWFIVIAHASESAMDNP